MEKLTLNYRCNQDWQQMPEKEAGRFCAQCNRCVVDFREKTLVEIAAIHANSMKPVCGIFKVEQVNYHTNASFQNRNPLRRFLAFATTLLAFASKLEASEKVLPNRNLDNFQKDFPTVTYQTNSSKSENIDSIFFRGRVLDRNKEPLLGANVFIKGTSIGTSTDVDGYFELKLTNTFTQKDLVIEFSYTGYTVQEKTYNLNSIYDFQDKIVMIESTEPLEEVIVVGYIMTSKQDQEYQKTILEQQKRKQAKSNH